MHIQDLPEHFWIVMKPSKGSLMTDLYFRSNFQQLFDIIRGGLRDDKVAGIYGKEGQALAKAIELTEQLKQSQDASSDGQLLPTDVYFPKGTNAMQQIYYVATLSRYVLVPASNAKMALDAAEHNPVLQGGTIITVRLARTEEIELVKFATETTDTP